MRDLSPKHARTISVGNTSTSVKHADHEFTYGRVLIIETSRSGAWLCANGPASIGGDGCIHLGVDQSREWVLDYGEDDIQAVSDHPGLECMVTVGYEEA